MTLFSHPTPLYFDTILKDDMWYKKYLYMILDVIFLEITGLFLYCFKNLA